MPEGFRNRLAFTSPLALAVICGVVVVGALLSMLFSTGLLSKIYETTQSVGEALNPIRQVEKRLNLLVILCVIFGVLAGCMLRSGRSFFERKRAKRIARGEGTSRKWGRIVFEVFVAIACGLLGLRLPKSLFWGILGMIQEVLSPLVEFLLTVPGGIVVGVAIYVIAVSAAWTISWFQSRRHLGRIEEAQISLPH